ncbi:MAG: hypothetical protein ABR606_09020 [Vicinamibacterales bacterium]
MNRRWALPVALGGAVFAYVALVALQIDIPFVVKNKRTTIRKRGGTQTIPRRIGVRKHETVKWHLTFEDPLTPTEHIEIAFAPCDTKEDVPSPSPLNPPNPTSKRDGTRIKGKVVSNAKEGTRYCYNVVLVDEGVSPPRRTVLEDPELEML